MNKTIKKTLRYTGKFFLGLLAFIALYVLASYTLYRIPVNSNPEKADDVAIYINSNGVHTDIVVPVKNDVKDWSKDLLYAHTRSGDSLVKYVAFGWGDKGFYLNTPRWSDLKVSTAAIAAFYLGSSAVHTHFYRDISEHSDCVKITMSRKNYKDTVGYHILWFCFLCTGLCKSG